MYVSHDSFCTNNILTLDQAKITATSETAVQDGSACRRAGSCRHSVLVELSAVATGLEQAFFNRWSVIGVPRVTAAEVTNLVKMR
jgi:hypothetical protein